jgi:tripartite-type tricarboxylate transporter receptor subunit TctC
MPSSGERNIMVRLLLALSLSVVMTGAAAAQGSSVDGWPNHPVRMIVPLPAGSAVDIVARLIGAKVSERLGQPIIVENRSGASGAIGTEAVAKAAPDGYTLGMATSTTHVTTAILNPKLSYDPVKDFVPVALIGVAPYVLTVAPKLPVKSVADLIALAKSKPGVLSYSSVGEASLARLATELMSSRAGIKLNHVPYRTSSQAIIDLAEGRIDITFGLLATCLQLIKDGKIRAIAVAADKRSADIPDVPTMAEAGMPGFEASLWFAVVAPAAIPAPILARLNREISAVVNEPDVTKALAIQAIQAEVSTPDKLRARFQNDFETWRGVAAKLGIKTQ